MRARDVAFIRKLCTLGLPPRALVLSLLPALRDLVPAHSAGVFWVDAAGQMTSLYAERLLPPDAMAAYYERHYDARGGGFAEAFRRRASAPDPVSSHSFSAAEQATEYFRDVLAPLDAFHVLYAVLRDGEQACAQVSLYRGRRERAFDREDAATLRALVRYLSMGLAGPERTGGVMDDSVVVEEAVGVVTLSGDIVSGSEDWRRLVRLGAVPNVAPSRALTERAAVEAFLHEMSAGQDGPAARQRRDVVRTTSWGRFTISAFRLADARARRADQVALLIRREEPRALSLVRGAGHTELSPQQREVALLLAQGRTNAEIARDLGLTLNTASYHVKQVYLRLGINDRDAVQGELLKRAQAVAGA